MEKDIQQVMIELDHEDIEIYINHMYLSTVETSMHQHKKGQLLYAEGGIVHIFIQEKHWYLPARCFIWIPSELPHSILTFSKKVDLYNIYFKNDVNQHNFFSFPNIYFANDLLREMILYTKNWSGEIQKNDLAKYYFLKALKENLPNIESTKLPIMMQHPFPKDPKLLEIAHFLNSNIETNYTIDEVAKKFGLSTRTLSRKFKEQLGMNYVRFLRSIRVTKAFELITEKRYSIYEITVKVGYSSLAAFSNIFYKVAGIRPTEYAKLISSTDTHKDIDRKLILEKQKRESR